MLTSLHIENIALIRRLDLEPSAGFCAFTGETGAGKSILIDAIGLLCGAGIFCFRIHEITTFCDRFRKPFRRFRAVVVFVDNR